MNVRAVIVFRLPGVTVAFYVKQLCKVIKINVLSDLYPMQYSDQRWRLHEDHQDG